MIDLLLVNYNLPEAVDEIVNSIHSVVPHRWIIVDNGSDLAPAHPRTTHQVSENHGWMSGLSTGLDAVTSDYVWVLTTSMGCVSCDADPLATLLAPFIFDPLTVAVSPAWLNVIGPWTHRHFLAGSSDYEPVDWASPAAFWRADFLKANLERKSSSGWGTDYELTYLAKRDNRSLWKCSAVTVEMHEHRGYDNGRRQVSLAESERMATEEMERIYYAKYGLEWRRVLGVR
jgi:hypothetical protein